MIYDFGHLAGVNGIETDLRADVDIYNSAVQQFNPGSQDVELANKMAMEIIQISGIPVNVYLRTDNEDVNGVWEEDANPTYWPAREIKAFYVPQPSESELTKWGVNVRLATEVVFCRAQLYKEFGERLVRVGDVLNIPYASMAMPTGYFRIKNAQDFGNFRYQWLYVRCQVETLHADITVLPHVESDIHGPKFGSQ